MTNLDVRVYPLNDQNNNTRAFASLSVDDLIAIKGIRVVEGSKGLFVTMPQSKDQDGNYHDIAFPLTADLRKAVNKAILDEYHTVVTEKAAENTAAREKSPGHTAAPEKSAAVGSPQKDTFDDFCV